MAAAARELPTKLPQGWGRTSTIHLILPADVPNLAQPLGPQFRLVREPGGPWFSVTAWVGRPVRPVREHARCVLPGGARCGSASWRFDVDVWQPGRGRTPAPSNEPPAWVVAAMVELPWLSSELVWRLETAQVRAAESLLGALEAVPGDPYRVEARRLGLASFLLAPGLPGCPLLNRVLGLSGEIVYALPELAGVLRHSRGACCAELLPGGLTADLARRMALCGLHQSDFRAVLYGLPAESTTAAAVTRLDWAHAAPRFGLPADLKRPPGWLFVGRGDNVGAVFADGEVACLFDPPDAPGDPVLLAARLQAAAEAECTLVTAQTPATGAQQHALEAAGLRLVCTKAIWTARDG